MRQRAIAAPTAIKGSYAASVCWADLNDANNISFLSTTLAKDPVIREDQVTVRHSSEREDMEGYHWELKKNSRE